MRHPCILDDPTFNALFAHADVSFCVTGSERVCPISAKDKTLENTLKFTNCGQ